jgi:hypothetical protein
MKESTHNSEFLVFSGSKVISSVQGFRLKCLSISRLSHTRHTSRRPHALYFILLTIPDEDSKLQTSTVSDFLHPTLGIRSLLHQAHQTSRLITGTTCWNTDTAFYEDIRAINRMYWHFKRTEPNITSSFLAPQQFYWNPTSERRRTWSILKSLHRGEQHWMTLFDSWVMKCACKWFRNELSLSVSRELHLTSLNL